MLKRQHGNCIRNENFRSLWVCVRRISRCGSVCVSNELLMCKSDSLKQSSRFRRETLERRAVVALSFIRLIAGDTPGQFSRCDIPCNSLVSRRLARSVGRARNIRKKGVSARVECWRFLPICGDRFTKWKDQENKQQTSQSCLLNLTQSQLLAV